MKRLVKVKFDRIRDFFSRIKKLRGNPHYVAMGMAIGVFVSITPTIPFHTALALALAFFLKGSKAAAAISVWVCNPVTAPFFYYGSYKTGVFVLGESIASFEAEYESIKEIFSMGMEAAAAMLVGGIIIAFIPGVAVYFITRKTMEAARSRQESQTRAFFPKNGKTARKNN